MEGESPFEWPPLESNPEVFTDYLHQIGLSPDWIVTQCFGLDDDCLSFVPQPTIAVIATFEATDDAESKQLGSMDVTIPYYMKQTGKLDNACGIIACLHAVLNNLDHVTLQPDSILDKFRLAA